MLRLSEVRPEHYRAVHLKGIRLALLLRAGINVPDGVVLTRRFFSEKRRVSPEIFRLLRDPEVKYFLKHRRRRIPLIVRSLDDDTYSEAGLLESYVLPGVRVKDIAEGVARIVARYREISKQLRGAGTDAIRIRYAPLDELEELVRSGRLPEIPDEPSVLVQELVPGALSGTIATSDQFLAVECLGGLHGPSRDETPRRLTYDVTGELVDRRGPDLPLRADFRALVELALKAKELLNEAEGEYNDWLVEWVFHDGLFWALQARPLVVSKLIERTVDNPRVMGFGERGFPVGGRVVVVASNEELRRAALSKESLRNTVLLVTPEADLDFTLINLCSYKPNAIVLTCGGAFSHKVLRARALNVGCLRIPELLAQGREAIEGKIIKISLEKGRLHWEETSPQALRGYNTRPFLFDQIAEQNSQILKRNRAKLAQLAAKAATQEVSPARADDREYDTCYQTLIGDYTIVLPSPEVIERETSVAIEFSRLENTQLLALLFDILRLTLSLYRDLVAGSLLVDNAHNYMDDYYPPLAGRDPKERLRAWNHPFERERGTDQYDVVLKPRNLRRYLLVSDTYSGMQDGLAVRGNYALIMDCLRMLKRLGVSFKDVHFGFEHTNRRVLAAQMLEAGDFSPIEIYQALEFAPLVVGGMRVIVPFSIVRDSVSGPRRRAPAEAHHALLRRILTWRHPRVLTDGWMIYPPSETFPPERVAERVAHTVESIGPLELPPAYP